MILLPFFFRVKQGKRPLEACVFSLRYRGAALHYRHSLLKNPYLKFIPAEKSLLRSSCVHGAPAISFLEDSSIRMTLSKVTFATALALVSLGMHAQSSSAKHPLDALSTAEYWTVHDVLAKSGHLTEKTFVSSLLLHEPAKDKVLAWHPGDAVSREADVVLTSEGKTVEARVDINARALESWKEVPGVQAPITLAELDSMSEVAIKDSRVLAALKARGITDLTSVHCEPIPLTFRIFPEEEGHRIGYGDCTDQHGAYHSWGRIIEGLYIQVDFAQEKILKVIDTGIYPMPVEDINFEEAESTPRPGTTPLIVTQPLGPAYTIKDGEVAWQNWHFRFRLDPRIGAVVNLVKYQDGDKLRSVMYEGSLSEMYVPYMDKEDGWSWRAFLDAGEFLFGGLIKPLNNDDCPVRAQFFTGYAPSSKGDPLLRENLGCLFERTTDNPAWRHFENGISGRPSRELVLRTAAVLGNYDYVLDWVFQQDGTIRVAVGATGVVETKGVKEATVTHHMGDSASGPEYGTLVAPNLVAVNHDHYFSFRIDLDVDGPNNSFMIDRLVPQKIASRTRTSIWAVESSTAKTEQEGIRDLDYRKPAMWHFINPSQHGVLGHNTGYEIMPAATAVTNVSPDDASQRVGGFSLHQLWVTPYNPEERYAAGTYVSSSKGMEGLPAWTKANRPIENTDIVAWYTLGFHHVVRLEDWPVMPTMWHDFLIRPVNFFDKNPVLNLPHQP
jgi:primary-amine oxidase